MKSGLIKITLLICLFVLFANSFAYPQDAAKSQTISQAPLRFEVRIEEKQLCVGRRIEVIGRLVNISHQNVIIDDRELWRRVTLKSLDQSSSNFFHTPKMGVIMGDNFPDETVPKKHLQTLKPKEFYEKNFVIRTRDRFFNLPGRYSITGYYGQYADWSKEGVFLFKGSVESNELEISLSKCGDKAR